MPHDEIGIRVFICGMILVLIGIGLIALIVKDWNRH